jgi:3-oxoacyl-[acyl-carrier-protein] synthase-1
LKVYVTGIGIISAIGLNRHENQHSISKSISGIHRDSDYQLMLGRIPLSNDKIKSNLGVVDENVSRTTLLSLHACLEALEGINFEKNGRSGIISSCSVGGMDLTEQYFFNRHTQAENQKKMIHHNGGTTDRLALYLGMSGLIDTISTACSSSANSIMHAARLIENGYADRMIAGGCDPLAHFDVLGFSSLNIYDQEICKPFDESRNGLNLGEAAAFLVLENELSLEKSGNSTLCRLSAWFNSTDAFHQTASSANGIGATMAMNGAIKKAGLQAEDIDYVNCHGTGTINNDLSESMALLNVFGDKVPPFSSTKGFTGHTLAAAGAVEAVFCIQAIKNASIPQNLNFKFPIIDTGLKPIQQATDANLEYVLSNSFGFGGNCSSLLFGKVNS